MQEEWAVAIMNGCLFGSRKPRDMVAIGRCSMVGAEAHVTLCEDEAEAQRIAEVLARKLGLPMYDGADPFPDEADASKYVDVDADGPDPYSEYRNVAQVR